MKRIIYNTKLKKKLIVMLLVMLLSNFIFSCKGTVVYAATTNIETNTSTNTNTAVDTGVTRDMFYPVVGMKKVPPENLENANSTDWTYDEWKIDVTSFMGQYGGTTYDSYRGAAVSSFNNSLKESYNSNQTNTEKMTLKDAYNKAIDAAMGSANGLKDQVDEQIGKEDDSANLGGILLSPLVYLFNFIADAVINIVGSLMMPGEGFDLGIGVLTNSPPASKYEKTYSQYVDVSSFTPTNIIGAFVEGGSLAYQYPNLPYTPEEIFSGQIELLSIDFISGKTALGEDVENDSWLNIRKVISQWYQVLRMIAIIGLLSVLIYTGIKILISANAKDKAQYKQWIMNWIMAVAILFFMHIIMAFIIAVTGEFSKLMTQACQGISVQLSDGNSFVTNLMGLVRFMVQSENFFIKVGYEVMYIALIGYTIKFTFLYLKRVLNMAFLTLIAPIVALTYPIDKINDGKAQGFDMWLKEYIFNALLQPMHCVLYYVLVGSAVSIAASNPIYGIVVLAFMSEAERLLKKIFGFDKAGKTNTTNGGVVSAFAAGTIASNIGKMVKMASGGKGGKGGSGNAGKEQSLFDNPKPTEKPKFDDVFNAPIMSLDEERQNVASERGVLEEFKSENMSDEDKAAYKQLEQEQLAKEERLRQREAEALEAQQDDIHTKAEQSKYVRGAKAVGKKLLKPVWDADKSRSYNYKRWAKGALKAGIGFSLGTAAAAVQAGISITDGKYNPAEGMAAIAAGYAGAGQISKGIEGLVDTYKEGALPTDENRKEEVMKRAQAKFADRDDVIAFNKKNYAGQEKAVMERQRDNYLTAGVTDLKDMKSGMKYADTLVKQGISQKDADKMAAATIDFKKTLQEQGQAKAVYDKEKQQKYIQSMVDKAKDEDKDRVRARYQNAFKSVAAYDAANK